MAGKTPHEAVQNYLTPLQRALSCVTQAVLSVGGGYHASPRQNPQHRHVLTMQPSPAVLGRDKRFALKLIQQYRVLESAGTQGPWAVSIVGYYYTFETLGPLPQEIVGYHWHPHGRSAVTFPHLHLHAGAGVVAHNLSKAHLPTGRIAVADVLKLAITHFGTAPLREDWETILETTHETFQA